MERPGRAAASRVSALLKEFERIPPSIGHESDCLRVDLRVPGMLAVSDYQDTPRFINVIPNDAANFILAESRGTAKRTMRAIGII